MNETQLLQIAEAYLEKGERGYTGTVQEIAAFAEAIYEIGCSEGWEDHKAVGAMLMEVSQ